MTNTKLGNTLTAIVCTALFSTTVVLSAVGPAQAARIANQSPAATQIA